MILRTSKLEARSPCIDIKPWPVKSNGEMKPILLLVFGGVAAALNGWSADVDFSRDIRPILELNCIKCHGGEQHKGGLKLDTRAAALKGGDTKTALIPGKPQESPMYTTTILPKDDEKAMPPKGERLSKSETDKLKSWIEAGASWPENLTLTAVRKIEFVNDIQPILEFHCVACHQEGHAKAGLRLDRKNLALKGSENGPVIVPGKSKESKLYTSTILPKDHEDLMPPANKGGPLPKETTDSLRDWIDQGAQWPEGIVLSPKKLETTPGGDPIALVSDIHKKIMANLDVKEPKDMAAYSVTVPGTTVKFDMVPIPGGEFAMGSPESEPGHRPDESPQHRVIIEPFWMGIHEVTWNEYELFMFPEEEKKMRVARKYPAGLDVVADAVSRPTTPYVEMSFGMGKDGYPAISMTQHAANTYCKWLSAKTGQYYRLPTEAEWEYACRAGTKTAYSFGDDPSKLGEYAWFNVNSDGKYQKVGKKKPNPWGLYDMHGNVTEWCLDQYEPDSYKQFKDAVTEPWIRATKPYPHVVRGGSWDDDSTALRSAARRGSSKVWKQQDPQLPKSIWFHTDAQFVGFRIIRPLKVPAAEELHKYWTSGVERD
jgi:formylglycine-generating enzyme required for sulfatase activity/mono/diheme cytochrome c family protein